ncbi:MAG: T9SS type B sorting domain-containing protein [Flavobacteriaceae bacterium]|nr:T9SS type B sorting domain-containing protein [Flavobacteriaceae bacterium]
MQLQILVSPQVPLSKNNINGTTNTFIGQNNGNFTSTAHAANTSNLEYTLDFTQSVNFKFTETTGTIHTNITGEYFILKIAPSNKNITLLDPDNQLLVDTNFDGIFESGIVDFSASEIRFKYNPSVTGTTPYQFIANQITQISFVHHLSNLTENSAFNGTIQLTCFDIDTDGDGIVNSFDSDSDNDGIPDLIEKSGTYKILSNTDANIDGLDDIFDITIKAIDTDNDGVLNFLDVDSDNDGIFDLEEAGHGLPDLDANGIIDNAIALIGANGFADALETNPDSTIIGYMITDTDNDSVFNYLELDSDNDTCPDVIEAGFTDTDEDGLLGDSPIIVDAFGMVINTTDGYTTPNINYITYAPIILNSSFDDVVFCEATNSNLTIDSNADTFQWQLSTDGIIWNDINNDAIYSGVTTNTLLITDVLTTYNNHQLRVQLGKTGNSCGRISNYITISVNPKPLFFSIPLYEQCDIDSNPIDGITIFNLESKETEIANNNTDVIVDFFETFDTNYSAPITNKNSYTNLTTTLINNYNLTVRLTNTATGCIEYGEIALKVNPSSLNNYSDMYMCEIDLNANNPDAINSLGSGNAYYDFDAKSDAIIASSGGAFSLATHTFEYYRTANDAALQTNQIVTPYDDDLFNNNSDVFVRISTIGTNACSGIGQFKVHVNQRPVPQGNTNPIYLCVNNPIDNPQGITIDLNADTGVTTDTYQWFLNGNLITGATNAVHKANVQGTYYVEAYRAFQNDITDVFDDSSCTGYNTFTVIESNKALITSTEILDNLDNPLENMLSIKVAGIGDYEFSLNSTSVSNFIKGADNFSITFNNVTPGLNTVYIRDLNGCGITASQKLSFLFFQRHFTPNNDGILDTWKILGTNNSFYTSARVEIFDRYGKVVALLTDKDGQGWNGTFNGKKLSSNDYWFNAVLEDINGNIRKETGHFSLLRK